MKDRFDSFGLESPYAESIDEADFREAGHDEDLYGRLAGEEEDLAWLETEAAWTAGEALDEALADDLAGEFMLESGRATPEPGRLEGGLVWTGRMAAPLDSVTCFLAPAALKAGQQLDVIVYVHGLLHRCPGGSTDMERLVASDLFALARIVAQSGKPILLVVPRMQTRLANGSWSSRRLYEPERLSELATAALAQAAGRTGTAPREARSLTLAGHSAGFGVIYPLIRLLSRSAQARSRLALLRSIWLLDASYPKWSGGYPRSEIATLAKRMPGLRIAVAYLKGRATDLFGGRGGGNAPLLMPYPAAVTHCGLPAAVLPKLLADHFDAAAPAGELFADEAYLQDEEDFAGGFGEAEFAHEGLEESAFAALADSEWAGANPFEAEGEYEEEAERRCGQDEALFDGLDMFVEEEDESDADGRIGLRERVLAAHIAATEKRKGRRAQADLREDQLMKIPGTTISTRKDTAMAAAALLTAANTALAVARAAGDAEALKVARISVTSGYRSAARQLKLWRGVFAAPGGYFDKTAAARRDLPGGPLGDAAVAYFLRSRAKGGFGIGGRIAAPGFSNHQSGSAIDFRVDLQNAGSIKHDSQDRFRAIWRKSWFHPWMNANAARFGFHPIPTEEWHWEYRAGTATQREDFDGFDGDGEGFDAFDGFEPEGALDEAFHDEASYEEASHEEDGEQSFELESETTREEARGSVLFEDELPPEPFRIRGGLYSAVQKKAAQARNGLILTTSVQGPQEIKLIGMAPPPIEIGKELTLWENRKIGIWVSKYNRFTHYYGETLRAIGRLRDLLSAGARESPTELSARQKHALRPTDDTYASRDKTPAFTLWRDTSKAYRTAMGDVAKALYELEIQRREFWAARSNLLVAVGDAKQLTKPEFEALDVGLGDLVSIATSGSVPGAVITTFALLGDMLLDAKEKRAEYDRKILAFKAKVRISNENVTAKLAQVGTAGETFWLKRGAVLAAVKKREELRQKVREHSANFARQLSKGVSGNAALAEIRMPLLITTAWWDLGFAGLHAKRLAVENLDYLRANGDLFDRATFIFDRPKQNSTAHEDIRKVSRAAKDLQAARKVLHDDEVSEWVAMNNLWDQFFVNYYR